MNNRWLETTDAPRGDAYDARFSAMAEQGQDVHGEASFVATLGGRSVLDAGCGTGRVAIELARRGYDVVGVDLDAAMLEAARRKAPHLPWYEGDLVRLQLPAQDAVDARRLFDTIVLAGNVMIFLAPGSEATVVMSLAQHLAPGGALIAGFQLHAHGLTLAQYDAYATQAGLSLAERWATWDRHVWTPASAYAVSVHRHGRVST